MRERERERERILTVKATTIENRDRIFKGAKR